MILLILKITSMQDKWNINYFAVQCECPSVYYSIYEDVWWTLQMKCTCNLWWYSFGEEVIHSDGQYFHTRVILVLLYEGVYIMKTYLKANNVHLRLHRLVIYELFEYNREIMLSLNRAKFLQIKWWRSQILCKCWWDILWCHDVVTIQRSITTAVSVKQCPNGGI